MASLGLLLVGGLGVGCEARPRPEATGAAAALSGHILPALPPSVAQRTAIDFEGKLLLLGYELEPRDRIRAGDTLKLKLYWKVLAPLAETDDGADWVIVTRWLRERGVPVDPAKFRVTSQLGGGSGAPSPRGWPVGAVIVDEQEITVPAPLATTELAIAIGVERPWEYVPPHRDEAGGEGGAGGGSRPRAVKDEDGDAAAPLEPKAMVPVRLRVIGGPSVGGLAVLGRLPTDWVPPRPESTARRARPRAE
jgi:hypothetical protein